MISPKVMVELHQAKLVPTQFTVTKPGEHAWSAAEQRRFWEAIHRFPQGPWTAIAAYVGSKSTRQAMTHAQKLRQKLNRWKRRVRNNDASSSSGSGASSPRSVANDYDDDADDLDGEYDGEYDSESTCSVKCEPAAAAAAAAQYMHPLPQSQSVATVLPAKSPVDFSSLSPDDVSCGDHDEYLDHLLSDIEPMLETVVNFTSSPRACAAQYHSSSSSSSSVDITFPGASYPLANSISSGSSFVRNDAQFATSSFVHSSAYMAPSAPTQQHSHPYASPPSAYMAPIDFRL